MSYTRNCPICGCSESVTTVEKESRGCELEYVDCKSCAVRFRSTVDHDELERLYAYQQDWKSLSREDAYPELNARKYMELLGEFSRYIAGKRLLDVGCGKGHFVYRAEQAGWDALGVEVTDASVSVAQRLGAAVINQDFLAMEKVEFDVVSMFELVEHLDEPQQFIQKSQEVLTPGGLLFITTPNRISLDASLAGASWRAYDPEHLVLFSPRQLADLVELHGFEIVKLTTRNISPSLIKQATVGKFRSADKSSRGGGEVSHRKNDQATRKLIYSSPASACLVKSVNAMISSTHWGSTIRLLARKK
ncbi:MAG: SAM-dependent methyltransferase [Pirellulaceae bacterium]|jgi:SAM-dependent methyltransferase